MNVKELIATQFPQWKDLAVERIVPGGHDHQSYRLGKTMVRWHAYPTTCARLRVYLQTF
ncbi:MAG: hypothetical protein S4CHLAM81_12630 [Chlamydiales bacterium]|nr:hypothetical protein [Chlamydiales bacterium]MCH9636038.1 hypothetical protein [Chlamydiales bacterium]